MANTPRTDNFRTGCISFPVKSKVGIHIDDEILVGTVNHYDGGDWIYVNWPQTKAGFSPNSYLRATQIFPVE